MNTKITSGNSINITRSAIQDEVADSKTVQNLKSSALPKTTDSFEPATQKNFPGLEESARPQNFNNEGQSVGELRRMISTAKAENKAPFSESNLNRLLAKNVNNYSEVTADLKTWVNKNMYLAPYQKGQT